MPVFDARDVLAFPGGDNATDTVIGGLHFNLTTLEHWNYTLYSNGTLSNGSWCMLTFAPYTPALLLPNGTFVNQTSCYTPVNAMGTRGAVGIAFASAFTLLIVPVLMNLAKHGRLYLPVEKRFYPIGRRWQWYWGLAVCAAGIISLLTNIDVERYYLEEIPIVLNVFFWYLMEMVTMTLVWEAVRHWGSWMERQFIDPDPFALRQDDRRAMVEFWMPLWFYLWVWLNFFLIVPRNWGSIELQHSPEQTVEQALPTATDARFKVGAFCLLIAWLTVVASLRHSIQHYKPRNRGVVNRTLGFARFMPIRFMLILPLSLAMIAYQALSAWEFQWSPLNIHTDNAAMYAGGYAPSLLILVVQVIAGFVNPNEDRELLRQRRVRGEQIDRELGIVHKPAWWRRVNGYPGGGPEPMRDRIARNVHELGGGRATAENIDRELDTRAREAERAAAATDIEMGELRRPPSSSAGPGPGPFDAARPMASPYAGKSDRRRSERTVAVAASMLFPGAEGVAGTRADREAELRQDGPPPPPSYTTDRGRARDGEPRPATAERSSSTGTRNSVAGPPQHVRSMLDV